MFTVVMSVEVTSVVIMSEMLVCVVVVQVV